MYGRTSCLSFYDNLREIVLRKRIAKIKQKKRTLIIIAISILLLILGINAALRSSYVSDAVKGYVTGWLEERLGEKIVIEGFTFHIFPTYLEINRFSISNRPRFKNEKVLHVEKIKINFRATALIYKTLMITKLQIQNPHVWIEEDPVSGDNYSALLERTIELLKRPLIKKLIKRWVVVNGAIDIDSRKRGLTGEIKGLNIDNRTDIFSMEHKAGFNVEDIMVKLKSASWHSRELEGNVRLSRKREGTIVLKNININDKSIGTITAKGFYKEEEKRLVISSLKGDILNGAVTGELDVSFANDMPAYKGVLDAKRLDPDPLLSSIAELPLIKKEINFNVGFSGKGFNKKDIFAKGGMSGRFKPAEDNLKGLERAAALIKGFDADFELNNGVLNIGRLSASSEKSSLNLSGVIDENGGMNISLVLLSKDINEITSRLNYPHASGNMALSGRITGLLFEPIVDAEFTIKDGAVKGVSAPTASGEIYYKGDVLSVKNIFIEKDESEYRINGSVRFKGADDGINFSNPYFDLRAEVKDGSPKDIVAIFYKEIPLYMKATGPLTFKGTLHDFSGDGSLNLEAGSAYGQEFDSAAVTAHLDTNKIAFQKIIIKKGKSALNGYGFISFKKEKYGRAGQKAGWSGHLTSSNIELQDINLINKRGALPVKGGFTLDLKGKGDFQRPEIDGKILLNTDSGPGEIVFGIKEMVFSLDAGLFAKKNRISGEIELKGGLPFNVEINLRDFPLNTFLSPYKPELFSSMMISTTGKIEAEGNLRDTDNITASINLTDINADIMGYKVFNDGDIVVRYSAGEAIIDSFRIKGEGTAMSVAGRLRPFKEYNLNFSGEADMKITRLFTKELEYSRGKAYAAVMLSGEWFEPKVRGALNIKDGALRSRTLSQRVEKVNIALFLNEKEIMLDQFEGSIGGGTVKGSGRIDLSGFRFGRFGMNFTVSNAAFNFPEGFSSTIDANIFLQGDAKERLAKGDILIKKGEYKKRVDWKSALLEFQKVRQPSGERMPIFGDTNLNIRVEGKENVWINNNTAKLPLEIDIILKGTINRPIIVGRVEAIDGEIYFRKNRFKVISGRVDFTDPERINPVFDIQALSKVRNYQINLNLTGTLERFNLTLVSDPPLNETDILALLTVGKTTEELAGAEQAVGTTEAASFATGQVQDVIEERLQEAMGFERFQVDPYYSSSKASAGPRLTVSKRFWEDSLYVTYSTNLATTEDQLLQIEYILNKNISLVGERDEIGRYGADIKFRIEFK
mgnify:FL=1